MIASFVSQAPGASLPLLVHHSVDLVSSVSINWFFPNHLCKLLCLRNDLVDLFRVVLVSLEKPVRHGGDNMICAVQVRAKIKSQFSEMFKIGRELKSVVWL